MKLSEGERVEIEIAGLLILTFFFGGREGEGRGKGELGGGGREGEVVVVFAIDCVVRRTTVSPVCACVLVSCVLTRHGVVTVNVCDSPWGHLVWLT